MPIIVLVFLSSFLRAQDPVVLGYFPSWSESWASPGTNSIMREIPSYVNHVFLSFAKPDLTYVQGSYDISLTGIEVPYDGCTLKETVNVLNDKGIKVILSVGGETYWSSPNAYNINYQQIKDLVDDMGFAGIDWDYEPNGSFSSIGTAANVQNFIDFITNSRALMPASQGYIIACAPSGVGALGGQTNDDASSPYAYTNRNTLTGETDANLYNATVPTNGINLFGFSATGHMIPVFAAVGSDIDLVAFQGYNLGASTNRTIMYDAYAYYAETYGFKVAAGVHYPDEPWGPYYTYTHSNVASFSDHIKNYPTRIGDGDGIMIWQLLLAGASSSAYSYLHIASDVLNGDTQANAINNANSFSMEPYSGGSEVSCFCTAPDPDLGVDQSLCGVSSINLNSGVAVQSGVTFTWEFNGTTVVSSSAVQNTYTITAPGTYTVAIEEGGCSNTDVIVITDNLPSFDLGSDIDLCSPVTTLLNTGFTDPSYSYLWTIDGVAIPSADTSAYLVSLAGTYSVVVSAPGCVTELDSVMVTSSLPVVENDTICAPGTVNLIANESVEWFDDPLVGTLLNTGTTYSPSITVNTDYWVASGGGSQTVTTMRSSFQGNGWQQVPQVYGTKFIVAQNLVLDQVQVDAGGGNVTINVVGSDGVTVEATTTVTSVSGLTTVPLGFALAPGTYYLNAVGSTSNLYTDITPASDYITTGVITIEGEAYWDWNSPSGANYVLSGHYGTFINFQYTVGINCDRVLVSGIIDPLNPACGACSATTSTSTASSCGSYSWNGTNYTSSGIYTWTGTNAAGCDSVATLDLTINPIYSELETISICNGENYIFGTQIVSSAGTYTELFTSINGCDSLVELTLNVVVVNNGVTQSGTTLTSDAAGASYQWIDCNGNIPITGEENQSYTPTTSVGNYAVLVTIAGCTDTSDCYLIDYTELKDMESNGVVVYPNPTSDMIYIQWTVGELKLELFNSQGKILDEIKFLDGNSYQIELSAFPPGMYFLNVESAFSKTVHEIIKI